jgi:ABC-2 type transport system ATP-binding protein
MADRIGIINHGRLIALGTVEELRSSSDESGALEKIFLSLIDAEDNARSAPAPSGLTADASSTSRED